MRLSKLLIIGLSLGVCAITWAQDAEEQGKKAFLANKCNVCHSIESAKIEKTTGGYQKEKEKNVPPDLTGIGRKYKAEWIANYLLKKEKVENVPHVRLYRGSKEELIAMSEWLGTLK